MIDFLTSSYDAALQWFEELPAFHQVVVGALILGLVTKLITLVYDKIIVPRFLTAKKMIAVGKVARYAVHKFAITNKDTRAAFDGFFFLVSHSLTYLIYALLIPVIYWGISSVREGNPLAFLASVFSIFFLREAILWLKKPSEKELESIDPELKKKVLEIFQSINYDVDDDANNQ